MNTVLIIISLVAVFGIGFYLWDCWTFRKYRTRGCQGRIWKETFPQAKKEEIGEFLDAFCDGFAVSSKLKLRFRPDDKMMDFYRKLYPIEGMADALEFETFFILLEEKYGRVIPEKMESHWSLGQLFASLTQKAEQGGAGQRR
jgi:hypothetical protein